jgi:glycosyltransferase involved in cell wall biosynthesis
LNNVNVLIVATTKFELNGITNVIMNYFKNIDKQFVNFDFVINNNSELSNSLHHEISSNNCKIYHLPSRVKKPLQYMSGLKKIINQGNYNIIHAHGNSATLLLEMFIAILSDIPVRISHCHSSTCDYKIIHYILKPFFVKSYTHAFACSHKAGKWLFKNNYTLINNGIEIDKYAFNEKNRDKFRKELAITHKKVIGHIGHFSYSKNHELLIDIFHDVIKYESNYALLLIGDGLLKKKIEEKVDRLGLNKSVIFVGRSNEVPQLISAMDLLVFPSLFEGLPLTLVEAQVSGLKCLISDIITREIQLTDLIEFISLKQGPKYWAEKVIKTNISFIERKKGAISYLNQVKNSGYDITSNAEKLKQFYLTINKPTTIFTNK